MAVKIIGVNIQTNYSWQDIKNLGNWSAVKDTNANWQQLSQTTLIGQTIQIEVEVVENNWASIKNLYVSWQDIKTKFEYWLGIKNW